jgi:quercetin dioxygenase-like cupin family protein
MKVIKRAAADIPKEDAHGGSGARKVIADKNHMSSEHFEAMTHGFLPASGTFDWHDHPGVEEIMVVVKGEGVVEDEDGEYGYSPGDVFIFPADVKHKIHNPSEDEHEMYFVRVAV